MSSQRYPTLRYVTLVRIVPAALFLLIGVCFVVVRKVNFEISNQIQEQVNNRAGGIELAVRTQLLHALDACRAIANNDIVINSIVDLEHRKSTLQPFIQSLDFPGTPVHNIAMLAYDGVPIAQKYSEQEQLLSVKEWLLDDQANSAFVQLSDSELIVAQPVYYGSAVEGALVVVYDSKRFFEKCVVGGSEFAVQLRFRDELLASSKNPALLKDGILQKPKDWLESDLVVSELPGLKGAVWQSNRHAVEAATAVRNALIFAVVGISGVVLLGLLLAVGFTTRQLKSLLEAIEEVRSKGDLSRRVSTERVAEFQQLQEQFNGMLSQLERTTVSRETYRVPALVANSTDNLVVVTDAKGRIEWVNEAFVRVSGYSPREATGRKPGELLQGPETDPHTIEIMRKAIAEGVGFDVEVMNYSKSGDPYWVSIESRPIRDDEGNLIKFVAIESDISARREIEEEKEKMSREMMRLSRQAGMAEVATGVLHNVGNVLNGINVSTSVMRSELRKSKVSVVGRVADVLEQNSTELAEFMTEGRGKNIPSLLTELSKSLQQEAEVHGEQVELVTKSVEHIKEIVRGQQDNAVVVSTNEAIEVEELVEEAIRFNQASLDDNGVAIKRTFSKVPDLFTDHHRVLQILVNLVANAKNAIVEYRAEDRAIEVGISQGQADSIQIMVKDNGVGIARENLTRIFGHGFTTRSKGHGFGLHSSALAAESVGGSLTVHSDGIGTGATFVLRLPSNKKSLESRDLSSSGSSVAKA
ncbi:MAG: sensor histidine kinase [Aureliella sp.]